jgi:hypothetical protein
MIAPLARRIGVLLALLVAVAGCASNHAVKCDGRLVPINPPPPKVVIPQKPSTPQTPDTQP